MSLARTDAPLADRRVHHRVFIASPGDVQRERQIAREVVLEVSSRLGGYLGIALDPVGWERDAALDAGRPQALINPLVRDCDVFVGILWARFGTATGEAESGTAEEFALAEELRRETGDRPRMMVFFSDAPVPRERLRTAEGREQFEKAEDFRNRFESSGGISSAYADARDFEDRFRKELDRWCLERHGNGAGDVRGPADEERGDLEQSYRARVATHHRDLPVSGFETNLRMPVPLEDVYVPVRARIADVDRATDERRGGLGTESLSSERRDFRSAWQFGVARDIRLFVVLGRPGSGKTTLLKHVALQLSLGQPGELGLPATTLPVFVPLRDLDPSYAEFASALQTASEPRLNGLPPNFLRGPLEDGRCVLLLDGLDEVADEEQRRRVSTWIQSLAASSARNRIVVTARHAGYQSAPLRAPHLLLDVEALVPDEAAGFLRRWYRAVATVVHAGTQEELERAEAQAEALIAAIAAHESLRRLASNPLMLQIIALVHRDRGALPDRRVELYEECTDVLLEHWDSAKGIRTGLSAKEARQVLQPLALWMHGEENRVRADERDMAAVIAPHLARLGKPQDASAFLRSVRDRSGLLTGYGQREYGFQHLSFQEYLAAEEIRNTGRIELIVEHWDESWWREVTRLLVGLGNPNVFAPLMRAIADAGKLVGHAGFTAECIRDALSPSAEPFVDALCRPLSLADRFRILFRRAKVGSARRHAAVLALRSSPDAEVQRLRDRIEWAVALEPDGSIRTMIEGLLGAGTAVRAVASGQERFGAIDGAELVLVPAGLFVAGCDEAGDENNPRTERYIESFYLARYPVTNAQYGRFLAEHSDAARPGWWDDERFNAPEQPVVGVSFHDAVAYCQWAKLRLPTEWEWEKAARGTSARTFPWGEEPPDQRRASFGDPGGRPAPVGSHPVGASPYGLHDMAGNVWEWTASPIEERDILARLKMRSTDRPYALRGGSFGGPPSFLRAAYRFPYHPGGRDHGLGFRCAQDP